MTPTYRFSVFAIGLPALVLGISATALAQSATGTVHPVNAAALGPPAPGTIPDDDTVKGLTSTTAPTSAGSAAVSPDDSVAGSRAGTPASPGSAGRAVAAAPTAVKGSETTTLPAADPDRGAWSTTVDGAAVKRAVKQAPAVPTPTQ